MHAINKKVLCVRLWKGDLFLSARSSFFFLLLSSSLTQNRALKLRFFVGKGDVLGGGDGARRGEGRGVRGGAREEREKMKTTEKNEKIRDNFSHEKN